MIRCEGQGREVNGSTGRGVSGVRHHLCDIVPLLIAAAMGGARSREIVRNETMQGVPTVLLQLRALWPPRGGALNRANY